jgi:cell division septum initiation protein DivIVA
MAVLTLGLNAAPLEAGSAEAERALRRVASQAGRTEGSIQGLAAAFGVGGTYGGGASRRLSATTSRSRNLTLGVQNAAYQVGDFAVQIASGTSATRAMAQQLPQLLGGFGVFGAVAGGVVAILGAFVMKMGAGKDATEAFKDAIDDINDSLKIQKEFVEGATSSLDELSEKFGSNAKEAKELFTLLAENRRFTLDLQVQKAISQAEDIFGLGGILKGLQPDFVADKFGLDRPFLVFSDEDRKARDEIDQLTQTFIDYQNQLHLATTAMERFEAAKGTLTSFAVLADADGSRTADELEFIEALGKTLLLLQEVAALDKKLSEALENSNAPEVAEQIGVDVVDGLVTGMLNNMGKVVSAAQDVGGHLEHALKDQLEIQSPSKVAERIGSDFMSGFVKGLRDEDLQDVSNSLTRGLGGLFDDLLDKSKTTGEAIRDFVADALAEMTKAYVMQNIIGSWNAASGVGGGLVGWFMGALSGREQGGRVERGQQYIVGEKRPEVFTAAQDGYIGQVGGGGITINQVNHFAKDMAHVARAEVLKMLPELKEASLAGVQDAQLRRQMG